MHSHIILKNFRRFISDGELDSHPEIGVGIGSGVRILGIGIEIRIRMGIEILRHVFGSWSFQYPLCSSKCGSLWMFQIVLRSSAG